MLAKVKQKIMKFYRHVIAICLGVYCQIGYAQLPPAPDNANFNKGDVIAGVGDYGKEAFTYGIPIIIGVGVLAYMWALISSYSHAKETRHWGDFSIIAVVGAAIMILLFILGNEGMKYFGTGS